MGKKEQTVQQSNLAFEFLQKLYHEVSYLIKEVEGSLGQEPEEFVIGKPSGYGIVTKSSTGLDPSSVNQWLRRKLSVFFVPKGSTKDGSQTNTQVDDNLRVIYLRIVLNDDAKDFQPLVYSGVLSDIKNLLGGSKLMKFENYPYHLELNERKVFQGKQVFDYKDSYISFHADLKRTHLFDLNDSDAIRREIIDPALNTFRAEIG